MHRIFVSPFLFSVHHLARDRTLCTVLPSPTGLLAGKKIFNTLVESLESACREILRQGDFVTPYYTLITIISFNIVYHYLNYMIIILLYIICTKRKFKKTSFYSFVTDFSDFWDERNIFFKYLTDAALWRKKSEEKTYWVIEREHWSILWHFCFIPISHSFTFC